MNLQPHEVGSPLWQKLSEYYTPQLQDLRNRIENPTMDEKVRVHLCYKIQFIKDFLAMAEEPKRKKETGAS